MAIEDYDFDDDFDGFNSGSVPNYSSTFSCRCKWCGSDILMRPIFAASHHDTPSRWTPLSKDGTSHFCDKRAEAEMKAAIASMPDADEP